MDPLTHALTGATIVYTFPKESRPWWFLIWGMLVSILPDIDILFVSSAIDYIKVHRGITHSLAGAWGLAFICTIPLVILTALRPQPNELPPPKQISWTLIEAWFFTYGILILHIWLDLMNSYGTQIFLPFNEYRVRLNSLFIVDLLLILPLIIGLLFKRNNRFIMLLLLLWTIIYPLTNIVIRLALETYLTHIYLAKNTSQTQKEITLPRHNTEEHIIAVHLIPDAFTPFHWKLILDKGEHWNVSGYNSFTSPPSKFTSLKKPPELLWDMLKEKSSIFRTYEQFVVFPVLNESYETQTGKVYIFSDLRFGSTIPFINDLQVKREGEELAFRIMAHINHTGELSSVRFITGFGAGGDTGWVDPFPD